MTRTVPQQLRTQMSELFIDIAALSATSSRYATVQTQHRKNAYTTSAVCGTNDGIAATMLQTRDQRLPV
jgi:hypothetical protein